MQGQMLSFIRVKRHPHAVACPKLQHACVQTRFFLALGPAGRFSGVGFVDQTITAEQNKPTVASVLRSTSRLSARL